MMDDQKNLLIAIVLSAVILFGWQFLYVGPQREAEQAQQVQSTGQAAQPGEASAPGGGTELMQPGAAAGAGMAEEEGLVTGLPRERALQESARVAIDSPQLSGSIALTGALVDDIVLKQYRETVEAGSPNIVLFEPAGGRKPYYAKFGWLKRGEVALPQADTLWQADSDRLAPGNPVTLSWDNGQGLVFEQEFSIDEDFMIAVVQRVRNAGADTVVLQPYSLIRRFGTPKIQGFYILHEGLLGVFNDTLAEIDYDDLDGTNSIQESSTGGWIGITDKYWLAAVIPDGDATIDASFQAREQDGVKIYQADYVQAAAPLLPGESMEAKTRLFAGAKEIRVLDRYREEAGISNFDLAVDFGWFYFLTKPIFLLLDVLNGWFGNFGLAILALTLIIKALLFPIANKSYTSMSRMKLLAPKIQEIKDRVGDDRMRVNQEMMELYKREKVNPAAGCLPIIPQMIIFFSLYKVLFVSIEMRHAPFYGWINDLSAPDPLGALTLFGLVQWDVPAMLTIANIGIWPILMGITMYAMQKLNPPPPDPMQAKIMNMLPFVFTFVLAGFPAGLVIYWTWNNILSIAQQWTIMKRMQRSQ